MWKKKIKNNKLSFLLIAIIILMTTVLLSTAFIFISCVDNSILDYYDNPSFPDVYMYNTSNQEVMELENLMHDLKKINNLQSFPAIYSSMNFSRNGGEFFNEDRTLIIAVDDYSSLLWKLTILKGADREKCPREGEVWISQIFSDKKGVQVGDQVEISTAPGKKFLVSGIINDSQNASVANPAKILYINKADTGLFSKNYIGTFAVFKYSEAENREYVLNYIHNNFRNNKYYMEKDYLIANQLSDTGFVTVFLVIAGFLTLISVIIVIIFSLKNSLMKEVKNIGTYKSLGFTKKEIKKIYSKAYLYMGIISTGLGVVISFPIAYVLQKSILKYLDEFGFSTNYIRIGIIIMIIFNVLIQVIISIELKKINHISPVEAFQVTNSLKKKQRSQIFKNTNNPVLLAINDIFKDKWLSLNVCLVLIVYMFTTIFFINVDNMLDASHDNANIWLNLHKTTATINADIRSDSMEQKVKDYLDLNMNVKEYGYGLYLNAGNYIKYDIAKYGDLSVYAIEAFSSYENLGFDLYEGHYPKNYNEINVSLRMLDFLGLKVGDYMTFLVNGNEEKFLIVGSFGSIKYGGYNVRMLNDALKYYDMDPYYNIIAIQLNDTSNYSDFKKDFEKQFPNTLVQQDLGNYNELMNDITFLVPKVVSVIVTFMFVLCALNIISIISIIMLDERRNIGIQKAIGFTGTFIKLRLIIRIIVLLFIGILGAILIHSLVSKALLGLIITSPNAIIFSGTRTAIFILLLSGFMLLFGFVGVKAVDRVRTIELMEE
ncbi:MAG: ABC transporter permease [Ruminiclostridium sp.]